MGVWSGWECTPNSRKDYEIYRRVVRSDQGQRTRGLTTVHQTPCKTVEVGGPQPDFRHSTNDGTRTVVERHDTGSSVGVAGADGVNFRLQFDITSTLTDFRVASPPNTTS